MDDRKNKIRQVTESPIQDVFEGRHPSKSEKEWAEPPIPWNELVSRWNQSRDLLEEKIRNFPIEDLEKQVPGRNYPYETLFQGIVEHTIYHSGQIAMASSMLRSRSS